MAEHYFTQNPESAHELHLFTVDYAGKSLTFETDSGVFSKEHIDPGSMLLCDALPGEMHGRVLDMGCGWGAMSILTLAAHAGIEMVMAEINERALALAGRNLERNGMRAERILSDGFAAIEGEFDLIMTNPPIRAGKAVIYQMFRDAKDHLKSGGQLWLVIRKQQGADSARKYLSGLYDSVDLVKKKSGYCVFCCTKGE